MLSVSKLGAGQEGYYLDAVAYGIEDYYLGHGEAPGRWVGSASELLDLDGQVDAAALRAVLEGRDPVNGVRLIQARKDRVPGFDLTFSAPKSVSVIYGLGDPDTVREVRAAHDRAVGAALGWLERAGCVSRRGIDGIDIVDADGFVAAAFVHRSSRAGDPQLHTHVLVANLTHCTDGQWRTLHGGPLLWQARTAGYLYKAQLRHELTVALGVEWGPVHKGAADIIGIPDELCALFSIRRQEIQDELDARGLHSPQAARVAALETRQAKEYDVDIGAQRDQWHARAVEAGHDPNVATEALYRTRGPSIGPDLEQDGIASLLGAHGLTEQSTTFDRRAVLRGWCEQLPAGATIATIEQLAAATLTDPRVVPLLSRGPFGVHSTTELLALERRLVDTAAAAIDQGVGAADEQHLRAALDARPELSPEQVAAVAAITTSGNGVDVIVAAAGTGKTFCLDAAHDAWSRAGYHVIGTALAASAARQLQTQTSMPSDTIALRTLQLADRSLQLDRTTVLVVDEAAMASTRGLAPLLDAAHTASAKVVMVGDPHQLDAIDAGGLLNGLAHRLEPVTLTENRRQQQSWERDALAELRAGHIEPALEAYHRHDRVVVCETAIDVRNQMAADWYAATLTGQQVIMLAERHHDVDDLNHRARGHLTSSGALTGPELDANGHTFQTGDRVLCLRNDRRLGLRNGTLATVIAVDPDAGALSIRTDDAIAIVPRRYLDAGHLTYGYALTVHKSQGATVDRCLVLVSDTLDGQAGYTALSRGRVDNRVYLIAQPENDPEQHHPTRQLPDPNAQLAEALKTDRSQHLAIDHGIDTWELRRELELLYKRREADRNHRMSGPPDRTDDINALEREHHHQQTVLNDSRAELAHASRLRLPLHRGEHTSERFAAERARDRASRSLERIDTALDEARTGQDAHNQHRQDCRNGDAEREVIDYLIGNRIDQIIDTLADHPPDYLRPLGPAPITDPGRNIWRRAAADIEAYRTEYGITDPQNALGPTPAVRSQHIQWQHANDHCEQAARQLDHDRHPHKSRALEQGLGIEL